MSPDLMARYGRMCARVLGQAPRAAVTVRHRRIPGLRREFDEAIAQFAEDYADQNALDHAAFSDAIDSGRLAAETGL